MEVPSLSPLQLGEKKKLGFLLPNGLNQHALVDRRESSAQWAGWAVDEVESLIVYFQIDANNVVR